MVNRTSEVPTMQRKAICAYQSENPKIPAAVNMVKACVSHSIGYMTQEVPRTTMEKKAVYKSAGGPIIQKKSCVHIPK